MYSATITVHGLFVPKIQKATVNFRTGQEVWKFDGEAGSLPDLNKIEISDDPLPVKTAFYEWSDNATLVEMLPDKAKILRQ